MICQTCTWPIDPDFQCTCGAFLYNHCAVCHLQMDNKDLREENGALNSQMTALTIDVETLKTRLSQKEYLDDRATRIAELENEIKGLRVINDEWLHVVNRVLADSDHLEAIIKHLQDVGMSTDTMLNVYEGLLENHAKAARHASAHGAFTMAAQRLRDLRSKLNG